MRTLVPEHGTKKPRGDAGSRPQARKAKTAHRGDAMFRALLENAPDAIVIHNQQGKIVLVNAETEKLFGYERAELLGQSVDMLIPERLRRKPHGHSNGSTGSAKTRWAEGDAERLGLRKNGTELSMEINANFVKTEGGTLVSSAIRDVSARMRAEQQLRDSAEQSRLLVNGVEDYAIFMLDPSGSVMSWNTGAQRINGYCPEEVLHRHFSLLYPREDIEAGKPARELARAVETGRFEDEGWRLRKDGSQFMANMVISALHDASGKLRGFATILRDITVRKKIEEDKELNAELERRVVERTAELAAANLAKAERVIAERKKTEEVTKRNAELERRVLERTAELGAVNHELEAFAYSVAHDLRAPLRHIDGFSKLLVEQLGASLESGAQHYLECIQESTRNMGNMVDDLLNLSKVARTELNLQVTGLSSLVEDVFKDLAPETKTRDIEWKIAALPFVECDPVLMKQVLFNLVANAVKFTRKRPKAIIEIGQTSASGEAVTYVRDNGVGFSMKYSDKLFGVFQRLHRQEDFEGTGVGLATVQRIVQKHGGRIWAEAELNTGATFFFTLGTSPVVESKGGKA